MRERTVIVLLTIVLMVGTFNCASAYEVGGLGVTAFYRNQTYFRLHNPDDLMQMRNEFNMEFTYDEIPHFGFFLQLRPFYDLTYDWSNKGTGGGQNLRHKWAHNVIRNNDSDPFVREAFVDVMIDRFHGRFGRQIVSWGKSDGLYMLDLINSFNYRNFSEFNEEDIKIPNWMANLNYDIGHGTFQFIYMPWVQPAAYPGDRLNQRGHDWELGVIGLGNDLYAAFDDIFRNEFGIEEGFPVKRKYPSNMISDAEYGLRWSGFCNGISYSLNYFYTWTDTWNDWPNTGDAVTATAIRRRLDRLSVFGFSLDRYFETGDFVLRLETAYTKGQPFVKPDSNLDEKDQIGYMLGYDRWIYTDWLFSLQLWQNYILNADKSKNPYIWLGANDFDWNTGEITNGEIDPINTQFSAYVAHDGFFVGDTGHLEVFMLYNAMEGYWWSWNKFRYEYNDNISMAIGCNFYWGNKDSTLGQFRDNDNIFLEFKYAFQ